jgi:transposase
MEGVRVSGITVARAVEKAGGLWTQRGIARQVGVHPATVYRWEQRFKDRGFPRPVLAVGGGTDRLWAGEDIIDWMESRGKWYAAQKMVEGVAAERLKLRALSQTGGKPK